MESTITTILTKENTFLHSFWHPNTKRFAMQIEFKFRRLIHKSEDNKRNLYLSRICCVVCYQSLII